MLGLALVVHPPPVHAYVDPGTGSYFLQVILAALLAASVAIKAFWGKIRAYFSKSASRDQKHQEIND